MAATMDAHAPSCCPKLFILRALDILTRHKDHDLRRIAVSQHFYFAISNIEVRTFAL